MTHVAEAAPLTLRRRLRSVPRIAAALGAVCLSLSIVIAGPMRPAYALVEYDIAKAAPVVMRGAKVLAPLRVVSSVTPLGLAVNTAAFVGIAAYETRDTWVPVVKNWFEAGQDLFSNSGGNPDHVITNLVRVPEAPNSVRVTVRITNDYYSNGATLRSFSCTDGTKFSGGQYRQGWERGGPIEQTRVWNDICPVGSAITSLALDMYGRDYSWVFGTGSPADSTLTTTVQCLAADGSTFSITGTAPGGQGTAPMPSCVERGGVPTRITTWSDYGVPGLKQPVFDAVPDETFQQNNPGCFRYVENLCEVNVWVDGQPCVMGGSAACQNWPRTREQTPGRVDCRIGTKVIPINTCEPLRDGYTTPVVVTQLTPGTDPEPDLKTPNQTDPRTEPNPSPNPTPTPGPTTGFPPNGTNPERTGPTVGVDTDPDSSSCFGAAWGWNPVDWVVVPIKCSLKWAFVPRTSTMTDIGLDLDGKWDASTPGRWAAAVTGLAPSGSVSGCQGPRVNLKPVIPADFYPLNACSGAAANVAAVTRLAASVFVCGAGFFACLRAIGSGLNWSPGVGDKIT